MRRTLVSRSARENVRPAERKVRTSSPSSSSTGRWGARRVESAVASVAVAARAATGAAADGDGLAAFADVCDLLAEVGARAALAHVALGGAVLAFAGEEGGHRGGLVRGERDVLLGGAARVGAAGGLLGRLGVG